MLMEERLNRVTLQLKEIYQAILVWRAAIREGQEYNVSEEMISQADKDEFNARYFEGEAMSNDPDFGADKWIKVQLGEMLSTVNLLNSIIHGTETGFPPEAIVELAVHNYKVSDSTYKLIRQLGCGFEEMQEKISQYMESNHPEEWKEYDRQCDEYDDIAQKVAMFESFMEGDGSQTSTSPAD